MIFKLFLSPGTEITVLSGHLHPIKACTLLKKNLQLKFPQCFHTFRFPHPMAAIGW